MKLKRIKLVVWNPIDHHYLVSSRNKKMKRKLIFRIFKWQLVCSTTFYYGNNGCHKRTKIQQFQKQKNKQKKERKKNYFVKNFQHFILNGQFLQSVSEQLNAECSALLCISSEVQNGTEIELFFRWMPSFSTF